MKHFDFKIGDEFYGAADRLMITTYFLLDSPLIHSII